jgi:hypothetical protein
MTPGRELLFNSGNRVRRFCGVIYVETFICCRRDFSLPYLGRIR